ncbi:MAG: site-specific integrase [Lachnospiraceae bacterium]|nr:site-specific integrase [Lachnospiraceae bacterium]
MAKGSVRKKGKKWYYRFYVEDASGNRVQKEYPGTESKAETEAMLRKAMEDYEEKKFVAKTSNLTIADLLDHWIEEDLKPGSLSNGTVSTYITTASQIKKHPIGQRKLRTVTADHLQRYVDELCFGGKGTDGNVLVPKSKGYLRSFSAVLQGAFRFAVYPKQYITFNPMQFVVFRRSGEDVDLFSENADLDAAGEILSHEAFLGICDFLERKSNPALFPIWIAYYTGLRIGEVCGLTWSDINLEERCMTVRRGIRYNCVRHQWEVGTTKRKKVRVVDFGDTLAGILKKEHRAQKENRLRYGDLYIRNYYSVSEEKGRKYYDLHTQDGTAPVPEEWNEIDFVCLRPDGALELPATVSEMCRSARKKLDKVSDEFHFHTLRHTYTSNMLAGGAAPKDVQELLGHSDVSTTMNIYAHAGRESKRSSAKLLDHLAGAM